MKRVSILVLIAMTMSLALVSCNGGGSAAPAAGDAATTAGDAATTADVTPAIDYSTPVGMEKKLNSYMQKGDFKKAFEYSMEISGTSKEEIEMMEEMGLTADVFAEKMKAALDEKGGLKDFTVIEISNDGETAELATEFTYSNGVTEVEESTYIKVDGKWRKGK